MEIKRANTSSIQQSVTSENTESKPLNSATSSIAPSGVGDVKDSFEAHKKDATQLRAPVPIAGRFQSSQLDAVKTQMTNYIGSTDPAETTTHLFGVMTEYLKLMNKDARADRKTERETMRSELAMKSAKLDLESNKIASLKDEASERYQSSMESSHEYLIGQFSKLAKGDSQSDVDQAGKLLKELKEIKEKLLKNVEKDKDKENIVLRYNNVVSLIKSDEDA